MKPWKRFTRVCKNTKSDQYKDAEKAIARAWYLLPPAYVVRREGNSFTLFVSPHLGGGGYPYPTMLCKITQNTMEQTPGGGDTLLGGLPCQGGTHVGYPSQARSGLGGGVPRPGQDGGGEVPS